jgi:hypothetical protein
MTTLHLIDAVSLVDGEKARLTRDGYLTANVRIARTGIQTYTAGELGLTDRAASDIVSVYRPASEVFHQDAMRSMAHRPITDGHPREAVTADNWLQYAKSSLLTARRMTGISTTPFNAISGLITLPFAIKRAEGLPSQS